MDKHPATPGEIVPTRELLADLLLEIGHPGRGTEGVPAVAQLRANRFRSLLGVARAAKQTGDAPKARAAYERLITLASAAADRPEIAEARTYLAN